jgi:hypothetical protein
MTNQPPDPMGEYFDGLNEWTREAEIRREEQRDDNAPIPFGWVFLPCVAIGTAFLVAVAVWLI